MPKKTLDYSGLSSKPYPLTRSEHLDPLLERVGDAKYVLLGEATHGTHEYYTWRAEISKRLIKEKGFSFVAVEGDWPDCYAINKWVKGKTPSGIGEVLAGFNRWPTWMWANWEVAALANWLKTHNEHIARKVGFYGLDVYSLWESMDIIVDYLSKEDPQTAEFAKKALNCFQPYGEEENYASAMASLKKQCKDEVVNLLQEVRKKASSYDSSLEGGLNAEMNALVMANAERYYRTMSSFGESSWNIRDRHMVETLDSIMKYHGPEAKTVIWEHNTHIGDARATTMAKSGTINVGQLLREQKGEEKVVLVGFGSYEGTVIAGRNWSAPMQQMEVPPAIEGSVEEILHSAAAANQLIIFDRHPELKLFFDKWLGHRAIGVVYHPERERGNYVPTQLSSRYDAFLFIDQTQALHPLHLKPKGNLTPETYPFGI